MTYGFFQLFSVVEWVIFGFIAANMMVAGVCVVHRSAKRIAGESER